MRLWEHLAPILSPYNDRLEAQEGLSASTKQDLTSHPELPTMMWRAMELYLLTEEAFGYTGSVQFKRRQLLCMLQVAQPEFWTHEVLCTPPIKLPSLMPESVPETGCALRFEQKPKYAVDTFSRAMTLAHQLGLIEHRGGWFWGLKAQFLQEIRTHLGLEVAEPANDAQTQKAS